VITGSTPSTAVRDASGPRSVTAEGAVHRPFEVDPVAWTYRFVIAIERWPARARTASTPTPTRTRCEQNA